MGLEIIFSLTPVKLENRGRRRCKFPSAMGMNFNVRYLKASLNGESQD
jgi:hypothetical protein